MAAQGITKTSQKNVIRAHRANSRRQKQVACNGKREPVDDDSDEPISQRTRRQKRVACSGKREPVDDDSDEPISQRTRLQKSSPVADKKQSVVGKPTSNASPKKVKKVYRRLNIKSPGSAGPPPPAKATEERIPKVQKNTDDGDEAISAPELRIHIELPTEDEVRSIAELARTGCATALSDGMLHKLPVDAIRKVAAAVASAKESSLVDENREQQSAVLNIVRYFGDMNPCLVDLFGALSVRRGSPEANGTSSTAIPPEETAGLELAAAYFDGICATGSALGDEEGDVGRAIMKFLGHVARGLSGPTENVSADVSNTFAAVIRSLHHALACVKYLPFPAAYRAAPILARCLTDGFFTGYRNPPAAVCAAGDLFQALLGQVDAQMQVDAVEELVAISPACRIQQQNQGRRGRRPSVGISAHTAAILRAVSAPCLLAKMQPTTGVDRGSTEVSNNGMPRRSGGGDSEIGAEFAAEAELRWQVAESRAEELTTGLVRRCLLAVRDREAEPEPWERLEAFVREVIEACTLGMGCWVTAPYVLVCLTKALARVATAARSIDLGWTQRDFAVRLLGFIAEALCKDASEIGELSNVDEDAQDRTLLRNWAVEVNAAVDDSILAGSLDEALILLSIFYQHVPPDLPCLAPVKCSRDSAELSLDVVAFPADHPIFASSFLLCSRYIGSGTDKKRRYFRQSHSEPTQKQKASKQTTSPADLSAQRLAIYWRSLSTNSVGAAKVSIGHQLRKTVIPAAARLSRKFLHQPVTGSLARARAVALETIQGQLRSSHLAFVRRQAASGLGAACMADVRMIGSRPMGEALSAGLQDDSACVRVSTVDLVGRLLGKAGVVGETHAVEFRNAVSARLDDDSSAVRRAAFRVSCSTLTKDTPGLAMIAADLLQRIQYETAQVKDTVLAALERVLFPNPLPNITLGCVVQIVSYKDVGGEGLRDILKASKKIRSHTAFVSNMHGLVIGAFDAIAELSHGTDATAYTMVLEQIALVYPEGLHPRVGMLESWLKIDPEATRLNSVVLAKQACRIFSDIIPSWSRSQAAPNRKRLGGRLRDLIRELLVDQGSSLTRNATECLCVVMVELYPQVSADVSQLTCDALESLQAATRQGAIFNAPGQRILCRNAWILGTIMEHLEADAIGDSSADDKGWSENGGQVDCAARLLTLLGLKGPTSLRPSFVPCVGFLLRRHCQFLRAALPGERSALDVFGFGLADDSEPGSFRAQTLDALASLLRSFELAAVNDSAPQDSGGDWGATVAAASKKPKISEAVQRLAHLQPRLLALLHDRNEQNSKNAISSLSSLSVLGVLHPSSATPDLLSAATAGHVTLLPDVKRLLLRLGEFAPQLIPSRIGLGLRSAAQKIAAAGYELGHLANEKWRFAVLCETYAAHAETRRTAGDKFLDILLSEITGLAPVATGPEDPNITDDFKKGFLVHAEMLVSLLAALPYRMENEIAYVVLGASRFLTLRAVPLLLLDLHPNAQAPNRRETFTSCAVAVLMHKVCQHLCGAVGGNAAERLLSTGAQAADGGATEDRQVPPGFSRRAPLDAGLILGELAAASDDVETLLELLEGCVPLDSPFLRGVGLAAIFAKQKKAAADGKQKRTATGTKRKSRVEECEVGDDVDEKSKKATRRPKPTGNTKMEDDEVGEATRRPKPTGNTKMEDDEFGEATETNRVLAAGGA